MAGYATDPLWADITPLPVDEGGPNPLAGIAYSDEYAELTSYLRAVMAADESSPRALDLTAAIIALNPAHYTVWLYRAHILSQLAIDLEDELTWLNEIALQHLKNYQIWHHRQTVVDRRGKCEGEREFVARMLERDAKNYHVWSYRQWLVRRFGLWDQGELEFTTEMIRDDGRNNSAWNHRWYVLHGRGEGEEGKVGVEDMEVRERELRFAMDQAALAPGNICPWNYLRGIVRKSGVGWGSLREFVARYADFEAAEPETVRSSYALDLMAEILAEAGDTGSKEKAGVALDLLATKYDPIRKSYWQYRKNMLGLPAASAAA